MSVKQVAEKWGISDRRVRILCSEGKIPGVIRAGRLLVNLELMKAGYPLIDIKFTDRVTYYNAFFFLKTHMQKGGS